VPERPALPCAESESADQRAIRLLGEAHAVAESGDVEGGLDIAAIAYEDFFGYPAESVRR
jgi:hypothetical protein